MINPVIIKIAVWALVIKEIWLLMQIPSVADTVISFVTVGEIPGTNDTLSLMQMILLLVGLFVVAVVLIFRKEFVAGLRRLFGRTKARPAHMPIAPMSAVVFAAPEAPQVPEADKTVRPSRFAGIQNSIQQIARALQGKLSNVGASAKRASATTTKRLKVYLAPYSVRLVNAILLIGAIIADLGIRTWKFIRPQLERFDKYLEHKVNQNQYGSVAIGIFEEVSMNVKHWWSEVKAKDTTPRLQRK